MFTDRKLLNRPLVESHAAWKHPPWSPPCLQTSMSMLNTRLSHCIQDTARWRSAELLSSQSVTGDVSLSGFMP
ncbi:MAG: hypothetical protein P8104_01390, partial [Gammaproteobacteria bacterium]